MKESTRIEITTDTLVKVALLGVFIFLLFTLRDLVLVVLTAVVIATGIEPFVQWFMKKGVYRLFSVLIVYVSIGVILIGSFYTFVPRLLQDSSEFLTLLPQYLESSSLWNPLDESEKHIIKTSDVSTFSAVSSEKSLPVPQETFSIKEALTSINNAIRSVSVGFVHSASSVFGGILSIILITVLSFYLAVQERGIEDFLRIILPKKHEEYVISLWKRTQVKIGLWMQGQLVLAFVVGVLVYVGLTLLGVRNALFFAAFAAVMETIPLFGPIIAAIPAVAVSYGLGGASYSFVVAALYIIIHQLENHLIYPLVVKKILGIPPILVILSLLVGVKLAGFLGILLSVPIAAMLVEFVDDLEKEKKA